MKKTRYNVSIISDAEPRNKMIGYRLDNGDFKTAKGIVSPDNVIVNGVWAGDPKFIPIDECEKLNNLIKKRSK